MTNIRFFIILLILSGEWLFTACGDETPGTTKPNEQSPVTPQPDPENPTTYETSRLWTEFLNAGQTGTESTLLDFHTQVINTERNQSPTSVIKSSTLKTMVLFPMMGKAIVKH